MTVHRKPKRSDAQARREIILGAAEDVFARLGPDAPLDEICKASGVGRATLYRNYPNRAALAEGLFERNMVRLEESAASLSGDPNSLFLLLEQVLDIKVKSSSLYLAHKDKRGYDPELRRRFRDLVEIALSRAKAVGRVRPDLTFETIELAFDMMAGALNSRTFEERLQIKNDVLRICLDGIRLPNVTP